MPAIDRTGAESLLPIDHAKQVIQGATESSTIFQLATRAPDMPTGKRTVPVLSQVPMAYFNNAGADPSDTSYKKTTDQKWKNKSFDAEEINCIVPIPEAVLDDTDRDLWAEVKPRIDEAMGAVIDQAIFYGVNAPNVWPTNLFDASTAAGNSLVEGAIGDLYDDIMGENGLLALVEQDGYMCNGHVASIPTRGKLRGLRDNNGQPLFVRSMQSGAGYELDGERIIFPRNGAVKPTKTHLISGDWSQLLYAMRQDITTKVLTEAVIQDPATGDIIYNLAQQDMVALRVVMRLAWQVPNPVNRVQEAENARYPFAVYTPVNPS